MNINQISLFRKTCQTYESDDEYPFTKYLRREGFRREKVEFISEKFGLEDVGDLSRVEETEIKKLDIHEDDRTLLMIVWQNCKNTLDQRCHISDVTLNRTGTRTNRVQTT